MDQRRMSVAEAAAHLGVKRETIYAYVSRGMLESHRGEGRESTFSAAQVEALAARTRGGGRSAGLEVIVASRLTLIEDDRLFYRGVDVSDIVPAMAFEAVAEWLWTGEDLSLDPPPGWRPGEVAPLDAPMGALDRLRVLVAFAGAQDELRYDLAPRSVAMAGRRILAAMVDGLPLISEAGPSPAGPSPAVPSPAFPLAGRLLPRIGQVKSTPDLVALLNAVLVLMADHELAASTLGARVAASVRADPYSVVSTGLGVISGALHGAASQPVVSLLEEIGTPDRAARIVGERLGRHERIPGLGHKVYRKVDPRAEILFDLLRALQVPGDRWIVVEALLSLVRERLPMVVNVDFALGGLVWALGLDVHAADAIFGIARTAGWIAHAIEEYAEPPLRFRPRAAYLGARSPG